MNEMGLVLVISIALFVCVLCIMFGGRADKR